MPRIEVYFLSLTDYDDERVTRRQPLYATVALSFTEAKYITLTLAAKEATWLRLLLTELGLLHPEQQHAEIKISNPNISGMAIKADQLAIHLGKNHTFHSQNCVSSEDILLPRKQEGY